MPGLAVKPVRPEGIKAVRKRQVQQLARHAPDHIFPAAVAQRDPVVDQPAGSQPAEDALLLEQEHPQSVPPARQRGGRSGDTAAADDQIIFFFNAQLFLPKDGCHAFTPLLFSIIPAERPARESDLILFFDFFTRNALFYLLSKTAII